MAPANLRNNIDVVDNEEEASPFLAPGQRPGGPAAAAALRTGCKAALGLAAVFACVAAAAKVHHGTSRQPQTFLGFDGLLQEVDTTDSVSSNATNATETCPDGYVGTQLDMQNHDADMHEETATLEECAAKCSGDDECKGFEHNLAAQHCWVSRVGHHCTDKQHKHWISCVKGESDVCEEGDVSTTTNATSPETPPAKETCPDGYVGTQLDMQNHDADMHEETASLEDCASKCNEDGDCKGFEHNMAAQTCWVTRAGHHCTDQQQEGWISCVKGDSDACEDGAPNDK